VHDEICFVLQPLESEHERSRPPAVPAWMTEPASARHEIVETPCLPLTAFVVFGRLSTRSYPSLRPWWVREGMMRAHKTRQRELFGDSPEKTGRALLPDEVREEVLQLLTQWLRALDKAMVGENRDEQDLL
jgi:hypothetical protein